MPRLKYDILNSPIDPNTGTPEYFNQNRETQAPTIDWGEYRRSMAAQAPVNQAIGLKFEPYGGIKNIDEELTSYDIDNDIPEARAQAQSTIGLTGKFIGQLGTEALLGMGEAVGYALDFEELANFDNQSREGFDNEFSKFFREAKEHVQDEYFPIYQTRQAQEGDFSDRLSDGTWWASQGKTIGTTIALMGPALAVGYATGGVGGAMVGSMASAMFSRKAESAMEANGVFQQEYKKHINEGKSDDDAKKLAGQSAATTFKGNLAMLPLDFMQYATLMKPIGQFAKSLSAAKATNIGKTAAFGFNVTSEGAEEGYQNIVQNEAIKQTRDGIDAFGSGFGDRLAEYIKDPEFQTSVFMGGVTGGLFDVIGKVSEKVKDKIEVNSVSKLIAANLGDTDTFNKIDNKIEADLLVRSINTNQMENLKTSISSFIEEIDSNQSLDGNTKSQMKSKASKLLENAEYIQSADEDLKKSKPEYMINPNVRKQYVLDKYEDKKNSEDIDVFRRKLNSSISESSLGADGLTSLKNNVIISKAKLNANKVILSKLRSEKKLDTQLKEDKINYLQKTINDLTAEIGDNIAHIAIQDPSFNLSTYTLPNINDINRNNIVLGQLELKRDIIRHRLAGFESKTPEDIAVEESEIVKEKAKNITKIQKETIAEEVAAAKTAEETAAVTVKIENSNLPNKEKQDLKDQTLETHNTQSTRSQQLIENNAMPQPRIIASNDMMQPQQTTQSKIIASNDMPATNTAGEVNEALSKINVGDQFTGELEVIAQSIEVEESILADEIPDTATKLLNEEIKTEEVIPADEVSISSDIKAEESFIYQEQFNKVASVVSIARKDKESIEGEDTYDENGHVVIPKTVNPKIFDPEYANIGSKILLSVDTQFFSEEKTHLNFANTKGNLDLIPIRITDTEGEEIGYVHTIEWLESRENLSPEIKAKLIAETRLVRQFFFNNGVLNESVVGESVIENKSVGWVNLNPMVEVNGKMQRQYSPIETAFKHDGIWDDNVEILTLTGKDKGNIKTVNDKLYTVLKGKTVVLIPGSNGQVVTKALKQKTLAQSNPEIQDEFVHNVLGIIYNATYNDISRDELSREVGKYLHATIQSGLNIASLAHTNKIDLLFNLDVFEGAPKNITISIRKPGEQLYDVYKVSRVDGRISIGKRVNVTSNTYVPIDPKAFEGILKSTLANKYLNLSKKDLANPKAFTRLIADQNYNVSRTKISDYRDFISYTGAANTSVHGVMLSNGKVTYTTQPTISYSTNISGSQNVKPSIEEIIAPEPVVTTPKARKSKLSPKGKVKPDSDGVQALGSTDLELSNSTISSFSLIPNVIDENELVSTMVNLYLAEFSESKEPSKTKEAAVYNSVLDEIRSINEDATAGVYYEDNEAANAQVQKYTKLIIDNFEASYNDNGTVKFVGYKTKIALELERLKFDPLENMDEDFVNADISVAQHVDNKNFKEDPEKSASSRIKRGLISIPDYEGSELKTNLIGLEVYRDYYQVFNTLMEAVSDTDINSIKQEVEELGALLATANGHHNNIYSQVNDILNTAFADKNDTFYNEFMSVFKKQRAKFIRPIIYTKSINLPDGSVEKLLPSISLYNSNKSGASGVLFNKWSEGVKSSPLVNKIKAEFSKGNESKTFNALKKRFDDAKNFSTKDEEFQKEIASIFTDLGFEISPEAISRMLHTLIKNTSQLSDLETRDRGFLLSSHSFISRNFMHLINEFGNPKNLIENENEDSDGVDNDLFKNQAKYISALAKFEVKVNPSVLSSSFRNGNGDVVYGFVNPHHLSNTVTEIKTSEARRRELKLDKFSHTSTWLNDENIGELELFYLDSATNGDSKKSAVSFEDMSAIEKEQIKAALVLNKGGKKGYFLTPTPSDKTTFALITANKIEIDKTNDLDLENNEVNLKNSGALVDSLYDLLVRSEIARIQDTVSLVKQAIENKDFSNLIEGEHYIIKNDKVVIGSRGYFFLIPQMNEFFKDRLNKSLTSDHFVIGKEEIMPDGELIEVAAKRFMAEQINRLHGIKSEQWNSIGMYDRIDTNYKSKAVKKIPSAYFNSYATMDYVVNSMVAYANQYMLITGDPASFVKADKSWDGTHNTWQSMVDGTITNMFKRIAKDIAPGYEGIYEDNEKQYNVLFINEPVRNSKLIEEYEGALKDQLAKVFKKIEFADAQEWTTVEEHIKVLAANGRISRAKKEELLAKYKANEKFTNAEIGQMMQPMKPVQVGRKLVDGTSTEYYIKTSSFPLIPQLTAGFDIDKLRVFMEENHVDRLVPKTAVKLGFFRAIDILNNKGELLTSEDGKLAPTGFKSESEGLISDSLHTLDRSYFRIQQDVPYDENKSKILEGSQLKKLKYSDLLSDWTFDLYGKPNAGYELKQLDDDIHSELYRRSYKELVDKLEGTTGKDGLGILDNFGKLKELLIDEAKSRGFDFNDLMLLNTVIDNVGVDKAPLFMHPALPKIEALLNSLIKNNVLVTKFPGKSYVQGSSMGFDFTASGDKNVMNDIAKKTGIKMLSSFEGELKYKINKDKSGNETVVAQVFMPWYFKESMDSFIDKKTGIIDESKIDPELLKLIGYRIPTQDHGSMVILQVVGFLPKESGDLLIVPPELSKIMGSDFDVDKLFAHKFNYNFESGHLTKIKPSSTDVVKLSKEELQNLSLDITMSILNNPEVAKRLVNPLDNTDVADVLTSIAKLKDSNPNKSKDLDFSKASNTSALFDSLHSIFVDINAAGKTGIGIGSIASTSHILSQYAGVYIKKYNIAKGVSFDNAVRFAKTKKDRIDGNVFKEEASSVKQDSAIVGAKYKKAVSNGLYRLDRIFGISGKRISQVIKNIQTEAVDNAKNQRLFGMNLNKNTFDTALFLAKAGLDEEYIGFFLNQPIIVDYVNRLNNVSDIGSTEFEANQKEKIQAALWNEYSNGKAQWPGLMKSQVVSLEDMSDALAGKVDNNIQLDILESFVAYSDIASKLSAMFRAMNTDTKYLGKSLTSTLVKKDDFEKNLNRVKGFGNLKNFNETLQLTAHKFGVEGSLSLFQGLLPYNSDFFNSIREKIEIISDKDLTEDNLDELFSGVKNAMWTESWGRFLNTDDIDVERERILFGDDNTEPLAKRLSEAKKTSKNTLINLLNVKTSTIKGLPDVIEFPSAGSLEKDFSLKMQQSWLQLYRANKDLALDLVSYCMVNGNQRSARDFSRFIPIDILEETGVLKIMGQVFNAVMFDFNGEYSNTLIKQYIQHNPSRSKADVITEYYMHDSDGNVVSDINKSAFLVNVNPLAESPYIYLYDKTARKQLLYAFDRGKYFRIPILGNNKTLLTEYNLSKPDKDSIFAPLNLKPETKVKVEPSISNKTKDSHRDIAATFGYENDVNVTYVLDQILQNGPSANMNNEGLIELVKFLRDNHSELLNTLTLVNASKEQMKKGRWGEIDQKPGILRINFGNIVPMSKNNEWGFPESTAEEFFVLIFTHELLHKLTFTKTKSKELMDLFDVFKSNFTGSVASKYTKDVDEFLSGLFTDKNLQAKLNSFDIDGKSLFSKIWDAIKKMISGDIVIKEGSLLDKSMAEAFKLIAPEQKAPFDFKSAVQQGGQLDIGEEFIPDEDYGDIDVQALMEFNFSEADLKEAEEIDKYCNGSKGKFGKIKK